MRKGLLSSLCSMIIAVTAFGNINHIGDFDFDDLVGFDSGLNQGANSGNFTAALLVAQVNSPNFTLTVNWGRNTSPGGQNYNVQSGIINLNSDDSHYLSPTMRDAYDNGAIPASEVVSPTVVIFHELGHAVVNLRDTIGGLYSGGNINLIENPLRADLGFGSRSTFSGNSLVPPDPDEAIKYYTWYFSQPIVIEERNGGL